MAVFVTLAALAATWPAVLEMVPIAAADIEVPGMIAEERPVLAAGMLGASWLPVPSSWNINATSFRLDVTLGDAYGLLPDGRAPGCICTPVTEMIFGKRVRLYKNFAVSA